MLGNRYSLYGSHTALKSETTIVLYLVARSDKCDGCNLSHPFISFHYRYKAFIPANPKRDEFVRYANAALQKQGHGGLVCSLSEALFKTVLVDKINNFLGSEDYLSRIGTVAIGKTNSNREENVFVLSEEVRPRRFLFLKMK